jgi:precorrin-2 dehydrogenase/sirohydrochlorin ferrochelatase
MSVDTTFYMAALNLTGRRCLVVGGRALALEKVEGLLACDAEVMVAAEDPTPELHALGEKGAIELLVRRFQPADLDGMLLVIAATQDERLNREVFAEAEARSMLVNVVDVPELCNFILPAIQRAGPVAVAVSTAGASPALAVRMRDEIAQTIGPEYGRLAVILSELRPWAKSELPDYAARKDFFDAIVNGTPDPIALLRSGDEDTVRRLVSDAQNKATR